MPLKSPTRQLLTHDHFSTRIHSCPPTAEALLYGVLLLQKKIRRTATIER